MNTTRYRSLFFADLIKNINENNVNALVKMLSTLGYPSGIPDTGWQDLAGERQSWLLSIDDVLVENIPCQFRIDISRMQGKPEQLFLNGIELRPSGPSDSLWGEKMHAVLCQVFEMVIVEPQGVKKYEHHGLVQALVIPASGKETAKVFLHGMNILK